MNSESVAPMTEGHVFRVSLTLVDQFDMTERFG